MLTRPLTLNESDDRGRGQVVMTPPPALPLADEDEDNDESSEGVFCPPVPPWSSSSPPSCASSSSSAHSLTAPLSSPFTPLPVSSASSSPPAASLLSPPSSLSHPPPPGAPLLSSDPSTPSSFLTPSVSFSSPVSSSHFIPPPCLLPSVPPCSSSAPPLSSPPSFHLPQLSLSSPLLPPSLHPSPPSLFSLHSVCAPPSLSSSPSPHDSPPAPLSFLLHRHSSPVPPPTSALRSPLLSPTVRLSVPPPPLLSPPPTAPAPPPCCSCSSLLPRLLSAHRLEVRRLLRGALASLGRRLDSLERRSRRKMRKKRSRQRGGDGGAACCPAVLPVSPASSCSPAHAQSVITSSSSSDSEDTPTPLSSLSQSEHRRTCRDEEEGERRGRKRRRKSHRGGERILSPENKHQEEEEEDAGRFVGRMAVSFRGVEEDAPLTLHNFNHRKHREREKGGASQSEKAISVVRRNGYRALLLPSTSSSSSQNALHLLQSTQSGQTCTQSAFSLSSGQWHFSDFTCPLSTNHSALHLWLCSPSSSCSLAPMMRLSAVAVEMMSESVRGVACGSPLWRLKDWTAPPSLSSDHCYVRPQTASPTFSARRHQKQRANHNSRIIHLPRRRALPLPPCSTNGLSASIPSGQSAAGSGFLSTNGERGKRVSQIRIRRASPRETPLTPMGLPKVKRLKKKEFSLEEIYTNKNYKSPSNNRSLETIFEEPREKDGALLLIGQQRRRRLLLFPDFTQPRKRKRPQGTGLPVATVPRKRAAARRHCHGGGSGDDESDLDVMLVERLSALEDFLTRQGLDV